MMRLGVYLASTLVLLCSVLGALCQAQITLDGSLGQGALRGPHYVIPASLGQQRGPNLFHSFAHFNILPGQSATFTGPATIDNILSRVTGGERSLINGILRSDIAGANVFLLNPTGILFGPQARLEVSGAFHASSADYLRMADGARFVAHLSGDSALSVAPPVAFGFLGTHPPAPLTVRESTLELPAGKTLSLLGGDVQLRAGHLLAPGGRIYLASMASAGEVTFSLTEPRLEVPPLAALGRIELTQGAFVDASGNGGGTVVIRSGQLRVEQSNIFADTTGARDGAATALDILATERVTITQDSFVTADVLGRGQGGDITITTGRFALTHGALLGARALSGNSGDSGDVSITAQQILLLDGGVIDTVTRGRGAGGTLALRASEEITLRSPESFLSGIFLGSVGTGDSGALVLETARLEMRDGSVISSETFGRGRGGDMVVAASEAISLRDFDSGLSNVAFGRGDSGMIVVAAPQITLTNGAQIATSTADRGNGGAIMIGAFEAQTPAGPVRGVPVERFTLTSDAHITSNTAEGSRGQAGTILLAATQIRLQGDAMIEAETFGRGGAGDIHIGARRESRGGVTFLGTDVARVTLLDGALIDAGTNSAGAGASVTINATDLVEIRGQPEGEGTGIVSNALGNGGKGGNVQVTVPTLRLDHGVIQTVAGPESGDAGNIHVRAARVILQDGAMIDSGTEGSSRGGMVLVEATDTVQIHGHDGAFPTGLFSNTENTGIGSGDGPGGQIRVLTPLLDMDHGVIQASSIDRGGSAGTIVVMAGRIFLTGGSRIDSRKQERQGTGGGAFGEAGPIFITATRSFEASGQDGDHNPSGVFSGTQGIGAAAQIVLAAPSITLSEGASIEASTGSPDFFTVGNAGTISIGAFRARVGKVTVSGPPVKRLILRDTARISSSALEGDGRGGNILLSAASIDLSGQARIEATTLSSQDAGNILIGPWEAEIEHVGRLRGTQGTRLRLADQAQITTSTLTSPQSDGRGRGGLVLLFASEIALQDQARIESLSTSPSASGIIVLGDVTRANRALRQRRQPLRFRDGVVDNLELLGESRITSSATDLGDAGDITVQVRQRLFGAPGSAITTEAAQASGGNIVLQGELVYLLGSEVTAEAQGAALQGSDGGNVMIGGELIVLNDSQILANAFGGNGGNITLEASEALLIATNSRLDASSRLGLQGAIAIDSPVTQVSGIVTPLTTTYAQVAALQGERCAERLRQGNISRFLIEGREGMPTAPEDLLPYIPDDTTMFRVLPLQNSPLGSVLDDFPEMPVEATVTLVAATTEALHDCWRW